ncbi:hypothetical protein F5Y10DRAFT_272858 [Nemania abortiva]|nr:hypothetical protein F5Y10DRAFT_272858 [Nemania abortiva]
MATKETPTPREMPAPKELSSPKETSSPKAPIREQTSSLQQPPFPEETPAAEETPAIEEALAHEEPLILQDPPAPANLPDELMLEMLQRIPGYHWPEAWFTVRGISSKWKFEAEKLFQQRYLSSMSVVASIRSQFNFDTERSTDKRAFFKCIHKNISPAEWGLITHRLAHGYSKGKSFVYMICFNSLGVINDTAFVDLQFESDTHSFSFQWLPTVDKLFAEEIKIRKMFRDLVDHASEEDRVAVTTGAKIAEDRRQSKTMMYYALHKDPRYHEKFLTKVRNRPWKSPAKDEPKLRAKGWRRGASPLFISVPLARSKLRLPKTDTVLSW